MCCIMSTKHMNQYVPDHSALGLSTSIKLFIHLSVFQLAYSTWHYYQMCFVLAVKENERLQAQLQ